MSSTVASALSGSFFQKSSGESGSESGKVPSLLQLASTPDPSPWLISPTDDAQPGPFDEMWPGFLDCVTGLSYSSFKQYLQV